MTRKMLLNRFLAVVFALTFILSMPVMSAIAEAADKGTSEELKDFLSAVTITDSEGNPID